MLTASKQNIGGLRTNHYILRPFSSFLGFTVVGEIDNASCSI